MRLRLFVVIFMTLAAFSFWIIIKGQCTPGISTTITSIDSQISNVADTATYLISVESITTEDENVKLTISGEADFLFNWTTKQFVLVTGATESSGLEVAYSGMSEGDFYFSASSEAWPLGFTYEEATDLGLIETSSYTDHVHVIGVPSPVGGFEVPINHLASLAQYALIASLGAAATVALIRHKKKTDK